MDHHQRHSEFQFCIEAISVCVCGGGRARKGREKEREREKKDSVFLLNKKLCLLNLSSLKPVLLFKGEEAQNCLAECIYECSKVFREKRQQVKEIEKFKFCFDSP